MALFKKKIDFSQFITYAISYAFKSLEDNFESLILMADEYKVLTESEKKHFLEKAYDLIIVDIILSCGRRFYGKLPNDEVGVSVSLTYARYLADHKKFPKNQIENKLERITNFFEFVTRAEKELQNRDQIDVGADSKNTYRELDEIDSVKFFICRGFSDYCLSGEKKSLELRGKYFAAFKFSKTFVLNDVVDFLLKEYKVDWK